MTKFKRGAFIGEKRVRPIYFKYHYTFFSPAFDVMDFFPTAFLTCCCYGLKCDVNIMPDFEPNEYLFRTHSDKGKERWEIYAWAVRDIMSKTGEFGLSEATNASKMAYYQYMMGRSLLDPSAADYETKMLLAGKNRDLNHFKHVDDELKRSDFSKMSSGRKTVDYRAEMHKIRGTDLR